MAFGEASLFVKLFLILGAVGLLLDLIGFATSYWTAYETLLGTAHYGLWKGGYAELLNPPCKYSYINNSFSTCLLFMQCD